MTPTEDQIAKWAQAQHERATKVAAIRFAIKHNRTWDHNHPENIKKQIAYMQSLLKEATTLKIEGRMIACGETEL